MSLLRNRTVLHCDERDACTRKPYAESVKQLHGEPLFVGYTAKSDKHYHCNGGMSTRIPLRGTAVGYHNWTFAGSDEGGRRAAAFYTLIATAKLNNVDPQAWVVSRIFRTFDQATAPVCMTCG